MGQCCIARELRLELSNGGEQRVECNVHGSQGFVTIAQFCANTESVIGFDGLQATAESTGSRERSTPMLTGP